MKLSTKGRYGLKAMFELTLNQDDGPVPLKHIAQNQNLSEQYLEQIFAKLRKSGLIKSIRGAQGGYLLAREASDITVGNIIRILDGPIAPSDCVLEQETECKRSGHCVTQVVWEKIKESVDSVIDSITLQDMVNDHRKQK